MSDSQIIETMTEELSADDVLNYLKENPRFLQKNPEACDYLIPPKNGSDKNVKDFQSFMIERLKNDKDKVIETTQTLVENARSNMNNQQRINAAILRLLEARNFEEFIHIITIDLSTMLDTDISVFVVESNGNDIPHVLTNNIRILPEGTITSWMNGKDVLLQSNISGIEAIYGGGATLVQIRISLSKETLG